MNKTTHSSVKRHRPNMRMFVSGLIIAFAAASLVLVHQLVSADTGTGSVSLATAGSAVSENFDTLSNTAGSTTNTALPTGWYLTETGGGARDNEQYAVDTGGSTTGDVYSYGAAAATERALGELRSGTLIPLFGAKLTNNTGVTITSLAVAYTGEQWRFGGVHSTVPDRLDFQYSLDGTDLSTGTYLDANALDFNPPVTTGTAGVLDGNAAANRTAISSTIAGLNIPNGASFFIRISDVDATGADDGLAIDNFSITPNPVVPTNPTGTGSANPSTVPAGSNTLLTVNVTPGTNPTSTGLAVTGDLSSIGGSSTQQFFDNQTNGDALAGDNIFSFQATVAGATTPGAKSLPIAITDGQARTGNTSIALTVQAAATAQLIHDIQGASETPNFAGSAVTIRGIVVGDHQGTAGLSGFFVEEEQSDWDANPLTSEGIFVFDGGTPTTPVNLGDDVTVTGTVTNFGGPPGLTELTSPSVVVNATGATPPTATPVALPLATSPAANLEQFEGMLVVFNQNLYVTSVDTLGTFGEVEVSSSSPLYIPTNSVDPNDSPASGTSISGNSNVAAVTAQQNLNNLNNIIIDDGSNKSASSLTNPLTPIPFLIGGGTNATLRRGDFVTNPTGIMNFAFGTYRLEQAPTITFTQGNPRPAAPALVPGSNARLASFNVENYFTTTGTGRGAANATELTRQRAKIVAALEGLNADVIGLIELQKAGGTVAASDLAAALTALGTVGTYASVAELPVLNGTDPDIKNGMIYRTSTVSLIGSSFTDTVAPIGDYSRDPVAQIFKLNSNGRGFAVVVHHARSKSCPGTGLDADQNDGQACFNDRRRNQSQEVASFVNSLNSTVADVLVVGDFNSYAEEDPIDVFRAGGFTDLISQYVSASSKYSFTFSGETGQLDHGFATSTLATQALGAAVWHIDADEPSIIDYTTANKPDDRFAATPYRASDHDPIVMSFNLLAPTAANGHVSGRITDNSGNPVEGAAIRLNGTQNRLTVTDTNGNYNFDNVETNGVYTVTPSRANFSFSPAQRNFSISGQNTDAAFTASPDGFSNPMDRTEYFVRQQYVDFLGREPDEAGLNFWVNNIESCGSNADCREGKRRDTSAAFFISIEFQQTGYFVDLMYKSAYGDLPNGPVPVTFADFRPDAQGIGQGVIVNQSGWEQQLRNNREAFVAAFVQRTRFTSAYPTTMTPDEFADRLFSNAGLTPAAIDRAAVVSEFGPAMNTSDSAARGRALQRVAESSALQQKEFNRAFVLMQYFGYLRRDPNASPDGNFSGYNFWLNKLDSFNGNYADAEMVRAFLVAGEYRGRFPR